MFLSFIILETDRTSLVVDQWPMQFSTALRQEAARVARHTLEEVQLQDIEIGWFDASTTISSNLLELPTWATATQAGTGAEL